MKYTNKKFEIERKFLVISEEYKKSACSHYEISQGYLNRDPHRTVRIRKKDDKGYITIKGFTTGIRREEYEYEIPAADADNILALCLSTVISKTRWIVIHRGHKWEVDEFHGALEGLVLAEIELVSEGDAIAIPPFIGREVSDDPRFFNSALSEAEYTPE